MDMFEMVVCVSTAMSLLAVLVLEFADVRYAQRRAVRPQVRTAMPSRVIQLPQVLVPSPPQPLPLRKAA